MQCLEDEKWRFDSLASKSPFYAQVWYDTHDKSEVNRVYPYADIEITALDEEK